MSGEYESTAEAIAHINYLKSEFGMSRRIIAEQLGVSGDDISSFMRRKRSRRSFTKLVLAVQPPDGWTNPPSMDKTDGAPAIEKANRLIAEYRLTQGQLADLIGTVTKQQISGLLYHKYNRCLKSIADPIMAFEMPEAYPHPSNEPLTPIQAKARKLSVIRGRDLRAGMPHRVPAAPVLAYMAKLISLGMNYADIDRAANLPEGSAGNVKRGKNTIRETSDAIFAVTAPWSKIGLKRRLQALSADGISTSDLSEFSGLSYSVLVDIRTKQDKRRTTLGAQIVEAYTKLAGCDPVEKFGADPAETARLKTRAKSQGWPPSIFWDDDTIDDPDAFPDWTGACGTSHGITLHSQHGIKVIEPSPNGKYLKQYSNCAACRNYLTNTRNGLPVSGFAYDNRRPPLRYTTPEQREEIIALLKAGEMSGRQIGAKFGFTQQTIWTIGKKAREAAELAEQES